MPAYNLDWNYSFDDSGQDDEFRGRTYAHTILINLFSGGLDDETSNLSVLEYANGTSFAPGISSSLKLLLQGQHIQTITAVSQLPSKDLVLGSPGYTALEPNSIALYAAFSSLIDEKKFFFDGAFNCPNKFTTADPHPASQISIIADAPIPYCFKSDSPIRGKISFNRVLQNRHIVVVNVTNVPSDALHEQIAGNTIIYLGGDHDRLQLPVTVASPLRSRYAYEIDSRPQLGPAVDRSTVLIPSFPFPTTYSAGRVGVNVALAKFRDGAFLFWATDHCPPPGLQLSSLEKEKFPLYKLPQRAESPPSSSAMLGAWVMRGHKLVQSVSDDFYPPGVLKRLRAGFFRLPKEKMFIFPFQIAGKLQKTVELLSTTKRGLPGFTATVDGKYICSLAAVSTVSTIPIPVLAAFIAGNGLANRFFCDVGFACKPMNGPFKINCPVPVGDWMDGRLVCTETGLIYSFFTNSYFSVSTRDDVAYLVPYRAHEKQVPRLISLPPFIS